MKRTLLTLLLAACLLVGACVTTPDGVTRLDAEALERLVILATEYGPVVADTAMDVARQIADLQEERRHARNRAEQERLDRRLDSLMRTLEALAEGGVQ